ncbi:TPA: T9SS type A sorting domain-containing protein [Candidatus Poribacteria bacterium]|nr:T9SS type A sorting domain-containing protein [Candidatus Poribacteria bacterium]
MTADVPINEVGEVIIQVTNPDSQVSTQLVAFTYILPEPTISSLVPKSGQTTGGETIIIRGDNFQNGATISFGKIGGIDVSFVSRQEIAVISPKAEEAGLVNIIVKNPDDQSASIEFIYKEPKPQLIWDINQDKTVDIFDLVIVAGQFGKEGESLTGDIDKNDIVDIFDLVQIASHFGTTTESLAAPPIGDNRIAYLRNALTELKVWEKSDPDVIFATKLLRDWMVANGDIPMVAKLLPNYPNPFNPETWIPYQIADASTIKLSIFDVTGSQIRQIEVGYRQAGIYENQSDAIYWDGRNKFGEPVTSGVYFYMLQTDDFSATRKMIVLK